MPSEPKTFVVIAAPTPEQRRIEAQSAWQACEVLGLAPVMCSGGGGLPRGVAFVSTESGEQLVVELVKE